MKGWNNSGGSVNSNMLWMGFAPAAVQGVSSVLEQRRKRTSLVLCIRWPCVLAGGAFVVNLDAMHGHDAGEGDRRAERQKQIPISYLPQAAAILLKRAMRHLVYTNSTQA